MFANIDNWIWMVLLFSACIFVHELGHFLAAAWCGLRAEKFAIGFGPKIWGFTRTWTDRNGTEQKTEFAICWLPFGGYVVLRKSRRSMTNNSPSTTRHSSRSARGPRS